MKLKAPLVFVILYLLGAIPCYASTPSEIRFDFIAFFLMTTISGVILGFVVKWFLNMFDISVSNWLIFLSSIFITGIIIIMLLP